MYYEIQIDETGRNSLREEAQRFNTEIKKVATKEEIDAFIVNRYGKMPNKRNKIYQDHSNGTQVVGFLHSFWNKDYSHNSKSWYQTDWITIYQVEKTPVL